MRLVPYHEDDDKDSADFAKNCLPVTRARPDDTIDTERDKYFRLVDTQTVQTPGTPLTRLDKEMHNILNSNYADDREKWLQYREILQKYLHKLPAKSATTTTTAQQKPDTDQKKDDSESLVSDEKILDTVPVKFKTRAKKLLDFARTAENITWDEKGAVKVNGIEIKGHITDLINDAVRFRKTFSATGRKPFSQALRRAGLPHEFVGNNQFWRDGTFTNNDTVDIDTSTSYRDSASIMNIDTSMSSASETSPVSARQSTSFVRPVIRNPVLIGTARASKKRPLELSVALNKTRIKKRRCIFQPSKRNYGGTWRRLP